MADAVVHEKKEEQPDSSLEGMKSLSKAGTFFGQKQLSAASDPASLNLVQKDFTFIQVLAMAARIIGKVMSTTDETKAQTRHIGISSKERVSEEPLSKAPKLTTSEKAQMAESTKVIQGIVGIPQTGKYDVRTDAALSKRIEEFQSKSITLTNSRTGVYDEKTAELMRRSMNPEIKQLAKTMDRMGQIEDRAAERTRAITGQPAADRTVRQIDKPIQPVKEQAPSGIISLNQGELKRVDQADRQIQKAVGLPQTGYLSPTEKESVKTKIMEAQYNANLPQTGNYDAKTAKAMREDSKHPEAQQLARALDNKDAVYQDAIKRSEASSPTQTKGQLQGSFIQEKRPVGDLVANGGIKADPLTPTFARAEANPGPLALDQKPQVSRDILIATSPTLKQQQGNNM